MQITRSTRCSGKSPFHLIGAYDAFKIYDFRKPFHAVPVHRHDLGVTVVGYPKVVLGVVFNIAKRRQGCDGTGQGIGGVVVNGAIPVNSEVIVPRICVIAALVGIHLHPYTRFNRRRGKIAAVSHQSASTTKCVGIIGMPEDEYHAICTAIARPEEDVRRHFPALGDVHRAFVPDGTALAIRSIRQAITSGSKRGGVAIKIGLRHGQMRQGENRNAESD